MPVRDIATDPEALTFTITADFPAPPERVWQIWSDPRQLERWWGPPGYPATFVEHDFVPGGAATYYMTLPDGTRAYGWWDFVAIDAPSRLEIVDGFGHPDGTRNADLPSGRFVVTFTEADGVTTMTNTSWFARREDLDMVLQMGMAEGMREALSQVDALLGVPA
ncbi:MAG: SRPBCC domain-containing protein [Kineosporiaceae bacterium]